jgi:hypothetical protein
MKTHRVFLSGVLAFVCAAGLFAQTAPRQRGWGGEEVMKAIAAAYPDRVGPAVFKEGDWAVRVNGEWFFYADGRLLPESLRDKAADYDPQPFYAYPAELPEWKPPDAEAAARYKRIHERRTSRPSRRSTAFFDTLWRARSHEEAYLHVKTLKFLGWNALFHYSILEELALIEEAVNKEAETNAEARRWLHNISSLASWNWRNIADAQTRSFHAYGAAVDIVMRPQRGKETYWLWSSEKGIAWWNVPYSSRLHPPPAVVKIFESYGFIWGGKWAVYDTMHFEYRPELFILNNIPLNGKR